MRSPSMSDGWCYTLLGRVIGSVAATEMGLAHSPGSVPSPFYFTKDAPDLDYHTGDFVTAADFRLALHAVSKCRGIYPDRKDVQHAYWDLTHTAPDDWANATILTLASLAPMLGVQESLKGAE